jgi:hypothetical protein
VAFVDNLSGISLVLRFSRESECVLGLSIRNLVDPKYDLSNQSDKGKTIDLPEPFIGGPNQSGKMPLNVLDVVELGGERIVYIDDDNLPIGLAFVKEGHNPENFDLFDLSDITDLFTDIADIQRIVVSLCFGLWVRLGRVLPGLRLKVY